jgi:hypothetical protein
MSDDRIAKLSQRFSKHAVGRKPTTTRTRERRSFYLDADLTGRIDQVYRDLNHTLYPRSVSKSVFLETVIEYGLEHLEDLKPILLQASDNDGISANS